MSKDSKAVLFSIFIVCLVIILGVYFSYAYFTRTYNDGDKKTNIVTESGLLDIDFETSEYITNTNSYLIDEDDYLEKADKTTFTIAKADASTVSAISYDIFLDDISISDNFKSEYFVWKLVKEDGTVVSSGNFSNVDASTPYKLNNTKISLSGAQKYSIYIYLKNDESVNQLSLLKGTFSSKVLIEAYAD